MAIDRRAIMEQTLNKIREEMPDETIGRYEDLGSDVDVETISTGSLAVDSVIGGGFAKGRLVELVGFTSSGKTTLALTAVAHLQKENPEANILYIDAENSLDPSYARSLGVNINDVYLIQPNNGEDGYKAAEMFIDSGVADLVVIDSIAAMIPKVLLETEMGETAQIGAGARLDSQGISHIFNKANKTKCTVILINQWKKAVKVNAFDAGDGVSGNYYQSGGQSLPFFLTQMLEIKRVGKLYEGDEVVSNQIRMTARKNKIAPPYRTADFFITFGRGLDAAQEACDLGVQFGFVEKIGRSIFQIKGVPESKFNGRQKFVNWLNDNPDELEELRNNIKDAIMDKNVQDITIERDEDDL